MILVPPMAYYSNSKKLMLAGLLVTRGSKRASTKGSPGKDLAVWFVISAVCANISANF